ncbi:MAG: CpaF family protein [Bdellovibrionales bacterium]|nr:CpaF family protein [Bdellovibrionales bacterium]
MELSQLQELVQAVFMGAQPHSDYHNPLVFAEGTSSLRTSFKTQVEGLPLPLQKRIEDEVFYWGPLQKFRDQSNIYELIVNGPDDLYCESHEGLKKIEDRFIHSISFQNFVERLCQQANIIVSQKSPFANGSLGNYRVHVAIPPASSQINITLRRHRPSHHSLKELWNQGFINEKQWELLKMILRERSNFLVMGPTGSGKTSLIRSLLKELSDSERMVVIEDTKEIEAPNPLSCHLLSRELCPDTLDKIFLEDLVKQSLRMRPDRLIVGEVRGREAKDLLMALATGHSGSMGTLHARTASQGLYRLEMLIQMGAPQWNLHAIRQLINMSLDYLVVLSENRMAKQVEGIYRITSHEKFGLLLEKSA